MSIYRFKLANDVVSAITVFAKIHQYDSKQDYKKFWGGWCEENIDLVNMECDRLTDIGYDGDVLDKMYKAGRYYFRKKQLTTVVDPKQRRTYINMNPTVIDSMDAHIKISAFNETFTPANGYDWFCEKHSDILHAEIRRLVVDDVNITSGDIISKIKKTYKNRYFIYNKSH